MRKYICIKCGAYRAWNYWFGQLYPCP